MRKRKSMWKGFPSLALLWFVCLPETVLFQRAAALSDHNSREDVADDEGSASGLSLDRGTENRRITAVDIGREKVPMPSICRFRSRNKRAARYREVLLDGHKSNGHGKLPICTNHHRLLEEAGKRNSGGSRKRHAESKQAPGKKSSAKKKLGVTTAEGRIGKAARERRNVGKQHEGISESAFQDWQTNFVREIKMLQQDLEMLHRSVQGSATASEADDKGKPRKSKAGIHHDGIKPKRSADFAEQEALLEEAENNLKLLKKRDKQGIGETMDKMGFVRVDGGPLMRAVEDLKEIIQMAKRLRQKSRGSKRKRHTIDDSLALDMRLREVEARLGLEIAKEMSRLLDQTGKLDFGRSRPHHRDVLVY